MLLKPFLLACWLTSVCATEPHDYTLTLSTYWQTYCLSLGMFQQTVRVFIHPHDVLLHSSLVPMDAVSKQARYRKALLIVIATSVVMLWNWIICPIYPLTMLISLNTELFPATFIVVVTTQTVNRCSFSILNTDRCGNHRVNELSSQVLCEMFSCNVWACMLHKQEFERSNLH